MPTEYVEHSCATCHWWCASGEDVCIYPVPEWVDEILADDLCESGNDRKAADGANCSTWKEKAKNAD